MIKHVIKKNKKQKIFSRKFKIKNIINNFFTFSLLIILNSNLYGQNTCTNCTITSSNTSGSCETCTSSSPCCLNKCEGYPYLQMRSQGRDIARQFAGLENFIYKNNMPLTYGAFSFTTEYTQSFNSKKLAHFLFGTDLVDDCELYVQGSAIENRNAKAWLADYFGLPTDFSSKVKFCPSIKNVIVDLNFYIGLDELTPGLFLNIDAPLTWTEWKLNQCEQLLSTPTTGYQAGYMAQEAINAASLDKSFLQIMQGGYNFADMKIPMRYGKINNCDNTAIRFAELDFTLGYNFILNQDSHFGALIYTSAPTGTRPCAEKLFEPIIGNGKHWELGAGLTASYIFYRSQENDDRYIGLWFDAIVGHLFKTRQMRSFDLCGKQNSRYMLLAQIETSNNLTGEEPTYTASTTQYAKNLIPLINWSTFNILTKINLQTDICIKLSGSRDNISFDLGYNFWARTGEEFSSYTTCPCDSNKNYAIKGDSTLYGKLWDNISTATIIPIGQTQSCATIHGPIINCKTGNSIIDNPELAFYGSNHEIVKNINNNEQIETSIQPVRASKSGLINTNNSPAGITHKIFGNLEYAWKDINDEKNIPFISVGGKVEFSQDKYKDCFAKNCNSCNTNSYNNCTNASTCAASGCNNIISCGYNNNQKFCFKKYEAPRVALSQWGIWIKGGVSFN